MSSLGPVHALAIGRAALEKGGTIPSDTKGRSKLQKAPESIGTTSRSTHINRAAPQWERALCETEDVIKACTHTREKIERDVRWAATPSPPHPSETTEAA